MKDLLIWIRSWRRCWAQEQASHFRWRLHRTLLWYFFQRNVVIVVRVLMDFLMQRLLKDRRWTLWVMIHWLCLVSSHRQVLCSFLFMSRILRGSVSRVLNVTGIGVSKRVVWVALRGHFNVITKRKEGQHRSTRWWQSNMRGHARQRRTFSREVEWDIHDSQWQRCWQVFKGLVLGVVLGGDESFLLNWFFWIVFGETVVLWLPLREFLRDSPLESRSRRSSSFPLLGERFLGLTFLSVFCSFFVVVKDLSWIIIGFLLTSSLLDSFQENDESGLSSGRRLFLRKMTSLEKVFVVQSRDQLSLTLLQSIFCRIFGLTFDYSFFVLSRVVVVVVVVVRQSSLLN